MVEAALALSPHAPPDCNNYVSVHSAHSGGTYRATRVPRTRRWCQCHQQLCTKPGNRPTPNDGLIHLCTSSIMTLVFSPSLESPSSKTSFSSGDTLISTLCPTRLGSFQTSSYDENKTETDAGIKCIFKCLTPTSVVTYMWLFTWGEATNKFLTLSSCSSSCGVTRKTLCLRSSQREDSKSQQNPWS